jgi:hypothetical protein
MVFIKHFDASKQSLLGVERLYVAVDSRLIDILPTICAALQLSPLTKLRFYEVKMNHLLDLTHSLTLCAGGSARYGSGYE